MDLGRSAVCVSDRFILMDLVDRLVRIMRHWTNMIGPTALVGVILLTGGLVPRESTSSSVSTSSLENERPCDTEAGHALDFWIGEWDLTWPGGQGGTPEGEQGVGTNSIRRVLEDCAIEEQFRTDGFHGMSISVYHGRSGEWRQTWVDSQAGYITLTGGMRDGVMELRTEPFSTPQGEEQVNRMIWTNVTEDELDWHWQQSLDGGATWQDRWVIHYTRRDGPPVFD